MSLICYPQSQLLLLSVPKTLPVDPYLDICKVSAFDLVRCSRLILHIPQPQIPIFFHSPAICSFLLKVVFQNCTVSSFFASSRIFKNVFIQNVWLFERDNPAPPFIPTHTGTFANHSLQRAWLFAWFIFLILKVFTKIELQ